MAVQHYLLCCTSDHRIAADLERNLRPELPVLPSTSKMSPLSAMLPFAATVNTSTGASTSPTESAAVVELKKFVSALQGIEQERLKLRNDVMVCV